MTVLRNFLHQRKGRIALYSAIVTFLAYTCIFSYRKAFTVAAFGEYQLWGIDYKIILVITQVMGYMLSKFYGIRFIAELKRQGRGRLILLLTGISWLSWLLFALLPPPYNFWCLFFNGFPLGMLWGVVVSYVEGRRSTDFISAFLAVSFIFGSGLAKSVGSAVMQYGQVSEYWMPFTVGLVFSLPLLLFVYLLEQIPDPDAEDVQYRMKRQPLNQEQRMNLVKTYFPGLTILIILYILVTILREVRDSFMADMWRESGEVLQVTSFAQTETLISLCCLVIIALMVFLKNNFKAFLFSQGTMFVGFVLTATCTWLFQAHQLSLFQWMTGVGLGLYMVYIPYNSNLFDRFISAFRITGNVGFLIYLADSFGYLGSVAVILSKSLFSIEWNWLRFYTTLVYWTSGLGIAGLLFSIFYFQRKFSRQNRP